MKRINVKQLLLLLTCLRECSPLLYAPRPVYSFSSSTWQKNNSCHTADHELDGWPNNPLWPNKIKWRLLLPRCISTQATSWTLKCVRNLTSDFTNSLSGISSHNGKCDYSNVLATFLKSRGKETSCSRVSRMDITRDHMLTKILL